MTCRFLIAAACLATLATRPAFAARATGIDVSSYQGSLTQSAWSTVAGSGVSFAFVRASRGGTTGTYDQNSGATTGAGRYDDATFANNMTRAKAAGILAGAYHFARADVTTNTGIDEANHFLQQAATFIAPGYLRPVLDLEAGSNRSKADLTTFALDFSDRVLAVTGVRPIVYVNTSYATDEVTSALSAQPLWLARYTLSSADNPTAADAVAAATDAQTIAPPTPSGYPNPYGVWASTGASPWKFWQYTDAGRTPGISGYVDQDVANGDVAFVRTFLVPEPAGLATLALVGAIARRRSRLPLSRVRGRGGVICDLPLLSLRCNASSSRAWGGSRRSGNRSRASGKSC